MADEKKAQNISGSNEKQPTKEEQQKAAEFYCKLCEKIYDDPGMCPMCDAVLKQRGE